MVPVYYFSKSETSSDWVMFLNFCKSYQRLYPGKCNVEGRSCPGLAMGKASLQIKGIFGLRPVFQFFVFLSLWDHHFLTLKQPTSLCPVSSVPVISELLWKVQMANDLVSPYISIESHVQCPFIEYEAVLIKWVKKFTFSKGRFSWFLMVKF